MERANGKKQDRIPYLLSMPSLSEIYAEFLLSLESQNLEFGGSQENIISLPDHVPRLPLDFMYREEPGRA
jgi:hypothetical protein